MAAKSRQRKTGNFRGNQFIDLVEHRFRSIALNEKAPAKVRLRALEKVKNPTEPFLVSLLKTKIPPKIELAATELLDKLRQDAWYLKTQRERLKDK